MTSSYPAILLLLLMMTGRISAADTSVVVVDSTGLPPMVVSKALNVTENIFRLSGMPVRVYAAPQVGTMNPDMPPVHAGDGRGGVIPARIVALRERRFHQSTIGYCRRMPVGTASATIFLSAAREISDRTGIRLEVVIGHALAHEVGHALSLPHSSHGLMAASWGSRELEFMGRVPLRFTDHDLGAMLAFVSRNERHGTTVKESSLRSGAASSRGMSE